MTGIQLVSPRQESSVHTNIPRHLHCKEEEGEEEDVELETKNRE